jgi:preprotein translocase subunit SecD
MLDFPRWKVWLVCLTIIICCAYSIPSFVPKETTKNWPGFAQVRFNLGLDLAGGSHLMFEADTSDIAKQRLETMEDLVRTEMRKGNPRIEIGDISIQGGQLAFMVRDASRVDAAVELMRAQTQGAGMTGQRDWDVSVVDTNRIVIRPTKAGIDKALEDTMSTAREVVLRRIDPDGTKEVTVVRQGSNRLVVQVPGVEDPAALKKLVGETARLDFKLVDLTANPNDVARGRAPVGSEVLQQVDGKGPIAVKRQVMVSGDQLIDANQSYDPQSNEPVVSIRFDSQGARRFARVTQENVGKPFAMILDEKVLSAPNINEPIMGGQAQISGNFTVKSANDLAIQLRSGKLPVKLKVIEERTISPELGADSINKGAIAGVVATLAVILFMIVTYMRFGVYTTAALVVNAFMILGIMAIFNATLTLPGIAGFVLTIGAAVDANVLINERIREEQRRGRNALASVEFGYKEASRAIFDANITNVISAAIMFAFGQGPVRGFAVVLTIGIITSVFTGVTFTRLLVADYLKRNRPKEIVI